MTAKGESIRGELIRVVLDELEAASEPIRGSVLAEKGERSFSGWMQLTAALEDARGAEGARSPLDDSPANPHSKEE